MNEFNDFVESVELLSLKVIEAGYQPTTFRISKEAIEEKFKILGLNIEIVSRSDIPEGMDMMVLDERAKHIDITEVSNE